MNKNKLLDAAENVVLRQGIGNLTLDAVAHEAGMSKGGLLHHFPNKDALIQELVSRCALNWRACYRKSYEQTPDGPGRMARALLSHCLSDAECWTEELRRSSSAVFAALAQNPSLIEPMRSAYSDLKKRIEIDELPRGVGEAIMAAMDGLWLYWVLGLVPIDQELVVRVRTALEHWLAACASPARNLSRNESNRSKSPAVKNGRMKSVPSKGNSRSSAKTKLRTVKRSGGRHL